MAQHVNSQRPAGVVPWWPEKRRERQTAHVPLSQDRVVDAALALIQSGNDVKALTMRKLAAELGVTPTSVYWWVGSRDDLIALVCDAVYGKVDLPSSDTASPWDEQIVGMTEQVYSALVAHAALIPTLQSGVLAGPNALAVLDRFLRILLDAGFSAEESINIHDGVTSLMFGFVAAEQRGSTRGVMKNATGDYELSALSAADFPGIVAVLDHFQRRPPRENMRLAVRTFLDGVRHPGR